MKTHLRRFAIFAGCSFVLLAALAFTPLDGIPMIMSLAAFGWEGLLVTLLAIGAPFGGFLLLLLVTPTSRWAHEASALSGMWFGTIFGSFTGLKLAGTL
ncbi:hypothetical protein [Ruegeria sp. PrR005]|uniref:Uncharacterized protein n=1 Tax=Ruegeria sp. PrR005 TaxID=2706882 RepID=A0A6B2NVC1_9RHOB|nr:hypothetical protein [Ruegeria sp. PrR005]NDW48076.1 hypothetical protein [Ruegeria sp. PrR005]